MSISRALDISASGLTAQRLRMDVISQNIANINTTRTEDGTPYRRKTVIFEERMNNKPFSDFLENSINAVNSNIINKGEGVRVSRIGVDEREGNRVYEPGHPDADEQGYVTMPNVNIVEEMVNMISANRSYEANITAIGTTKSMAAKTLEISR